MNKSESIVNIALALNKFQAVIEGAKKSTDNKFYNTKYADLAEVWKTIREPLTANGLSVVQLPCQAYDVRYSEKSTSDITRENGTAEKNFTEKEKVVLHISVETVLLHESGEWISSVMPVPIVNHNPQAIGSAITYARRYGLTAILGIHQEDDDANEDVKPNLKKYKYTRKSLATFLLGTDVSDAIREEYTKRIEACPEIEFETIAAELGSYPSKSTVKSTKQDILQTKQAVCSVLQSLIDLGIGNYDNEKHRANSIKKHLGTDKVNDCEDAVKLTEYLAYLQDKLDGAGK